MSTIDLPYDLHMGRITAIQAAELAGVRPDVIRQWASRGYVDPKTKQRHRLTRHDTCRGTRYQPIEVLRAEAATRERAKRQVMAFGV